MSRFVAVVPELEQVTIHPRHQSNNYAVNLDIVAAVNRFEYSAADGYTDKQYPIVGLNFRLLGGETVKWEFLDSDRAYRDKLYSYIVDRTVDR